nr:cupin domain-containing protein [uncultured Duganella sp.]
MQSAFEFLLGSQGRQHFFREIYQREARLYQGRPGKFSHIFSLDGLNQLLNYMPLNYPQVRVTDHHNTIHKYDLIVDQDRYANNVNNEINGEKLLRAIARGGTMVIDRIHTHVPALEDFIDRLKHELGVRFAANGYYSSHRQLGVNPHFDRHDVFAIQIHGSKRWYFKKDQHVLSQPMRRQATPAIDEARAGWDSVLVKEGDVFYCPRGMWHFTQTEDDKSAHIALGLYPMTLKDWLTEQEQESSVAELLEAYVQDLRGDDPQRLSHQLQQLTNLLQEKACQPAQPKITLRPHLQLD